LKKGGQCFIQTPFKSGEMYENNAIVDPADRLKHFGQDDHVRIYSVKGLVERLRSVGFATKTISFTESQDNYYGYKVEENIIIAIK
jgi:hypothetical protein